MENRDSIIISLRGATLGTISEESSPEELFQNSTLRPILKLQNDLLINIFIDYAKQQKNVFFALNVDKKLNYIEHSLQKDMKFRNLLKGIVIGFLTINEYQIYAKNASNLNKRITNLLIERLKSQVQLVINH